MKRKMIIITFLFILISISSQIELPFSPVGYKYEIFVRPVTSKRLYMGNKNEEFLYNFDTKQKEIEVTSQHLSICVYGSVCPTLVKDENNEPKYLISKGDERIRVTDIKFNTYYEKNAGKDTRGMQLIDSNNILITHRFSDNGFLTTATRGFSILNFITKEVKNFVVNQSTEIGGLYLSSGYILGITVYSKSSNPFFFYLNRNLEEKSGYQNLNGYTDVGYGYFQIIELSNNRIIFCALTSDLNVVRCYSGLSEGVKFSYIKKNEIISGCGLYHDTDSHFSFFKFSDDLGIVGCGIGSITIALFDYELTTKFQIKLGFNSNYADFYLLDNQELFIYYSKTDSSNNFHYYGDWFHFPYCIDGKAFIQAHRKYSLREIFENIKTPSTLENTEKIKFSLLEIKGKLTRPSSSIEKGVTYNIDDISYYSDDSTKDKFVFRGINIVFETEIESTSECTIEIVVCYDYCKTCSREKQGDDMGCSSCDISNYYFPMEGGTSSNCYNKTNIPINYFLDSSKNKYRKCLDNCLTCNELGDENTDTKCSECNLAHNYFPVEDHESHCVQTYKEGYVKYNNKFMKCYKGCKSCSSPKIGTNHYCIECAENFVENPFKAKNCITDCKDSYFYVGKEFEYFCTEGYNCPDSYPILIKETGQCVISCADIFSCESCLNDGPLYELNHHCVKSCPNGILYGSICNQVLSSNPQVEVEGNMYEYKGNSDIKKEDFSKMKDQALEVVKNTLNSDPDGVTKITGEDFSYEFYPNDMPKEELSEKSIPKVDISECEGAIREIYNLEPDEDIYISQMVYNSSSSQSATNKVQYEIYFRRADGELHQVDPSVCENSKIKISSPITNIPDSSLSLAEELLKEGIDIFNASDPVFNDHCTTLSIDGKDVSMSDRRNSVFKNISFCSEGCDLVYLNVTTKEAECECAPQEVGIGSLLEENELFSMFSGLLSSTNIELFICGKIFGELPKEITSNIGCIMMGINFVLTSGFIFIFLFFQIKGVYMRLNWHFSSPPPFFIQNFISSKIDPGSDASTESVKIHDLSQEENTNEKDYKKRDAHTTTKTKNDKEEEEEEEFEPEELNEMEFKEAVIHDHRTFCQMYIFSISEKQVILSTILNRSIFYPLSLRIILLLFSLSSFFFLNALFFTEEFISNRYNTTEKLNIIYILKNELSKSVYASLLGMLIGKVLMMITSNGGKYIRMIKEKKEDPNYYNTFHDFVVDLKKRYYIVLILVFIFSLGYWYYLFIFSFVYKNNQISWIQSTFISIALNIILPLLICLILDTFKYLGLKYKNRYLFYISSFCYSLI